MHRRLPLILLHEIPFRIREFSYLHQTRIESAFWIFAATHIHKVRVDSWKLDIRKLFEERIAAAAPRKRIEEAANTEQTVYQHFVRKIAFSFGLMPNDFNLILLLCVFFCCSLCTRRGRIKMKNGTDSLVRMTHKNIAANCSPHSLNKSTR